MNAFRRTRVAAALVLIQTISVTAVLADETATRAAPGALLLEQRIVMHRVSGTFEVKLDPKPIENQTAPTTLARLAIDKQFHGALEATSLGNMLSAGTAVKGSAGYVAIERVTGRLEGREGSFVLQHTGTLNRGAPSLSITVVPDSGTDALTGLRGTMAIRIEAGGAHFYDFDYAVDPPAPAAAGTP